MHPESLANYKLQVYNPGSPNPSPRSDPLKNFSKVNTDNDQETSLILTTKRKRKTVQNLVEIPVTPSKKKKMMSPEDVKNLYEELRKAHKEDLKEIQKENKDDIKDLKEYIARMRSEDETRVNTQLNTRFNNMEKQLTTISEAQAKESKATIENKADTDARIKALEEKFDELQKQNMASSQMVNQNDIEDAVKRCVDSAGSIPDATWKANLAKEVAEHEHGLIIHGVSLAGNSFEEKKGFIKMFLKNELKASEDLVNRVRIRDVCRLGPGNTASGKPSPILVKFSHPTERNQILPLSFNLKNGIDIDKSVPKLYQKKHKDFKRHAWKLKLLHDVQSQVIFEGFNLVLRYKKKDDKINQYKWIVKDEWHPQPTDLTALTTRSAVDNDTDKQESPIIDTSSSAACNRTLIVTGLPVTIAQNNVKEELKKLFADEDHEKLYDIVLKAKGVALITCKDWTGCKAISETYKKTKIGEKQIFFTLYSEADPNMI